MLSNILNGWRPVIIKTIILCSVIGATVWGTSAFAQAFVMRANWVCNSTEAIGEALKNANESPIAVGKIEVQGADVLIMSIWASKEGGWSIIVTSQKYPDRSCIVIAGEELIFSERGIKVQPPSKNTY